MANKTGVVRYYVTTDTHGYPWGFRNGVNGKTIHFDLGDNTAGYVGSAANVVLDKPEKMSVAANIALRGNHDTSVMGINPESDTSTYSLQVYKDTANKIMVFGLDTGTNDVNVLKIPVMQVKEMARLIQDECSDGWDIIILTHVPLFDGNSTVFGACWDSNCTKPQNTDILLNVLKAFKLRTTYTVANTKYDFSRNTGFLIGCFAGHVHNHIKGVQEFGGVRFPYECFPTNGADEYPKGVSPQRNQGLYVPYDCYINVNFDYQTINGTSYANPPAAYDESRSNYHSSSNNYYQDKVNGLFKFNGTSKYYPKFYNGVYIGYTESILQGTVLGNNGGDGRFWSLESITNINANGTTYTTNAIWFDSNGRLRYYAKSNSPIGNSTSYKQIEGYSDANMTVTFKSNNIQWTFKAGYLVSATPTYCSGSLTGKNGYTLEFNSDGAPYQIKLNGVVKTYGAGDNWINVTDIRIYDKTVEKNLIRIPQLGITGTFNSESKINLAREDSNGANQISSPSKLLIRVQGVSGNPMWIYDGKLTSLTDQQVL